MAADPDVTPVRFTVEQYERMGETTILDPDTRYELLDGVITMMSPAGPRHSATVDRIAAQFIQRLAGQATIKIQNPIRLGPDSELEPDILVARYRSDFYEFAHPTAADALLALEVSDSSIRVDRLVKVPIFARHGLPEVWIVNLGDRCVEVYRDLQDGTYRDVRTYRGDEPFSCAAFPDVTFTARELLGDG
jgi:Uma2 family endonuclease